MSYRITISGNTVLEKCIQDVQFNTTTSNDYSSMNTNIKNSIKISGYIDANESTVVLYNWALLSATNPDCYKEITVEEYRSDKLLRKVTFSNAFVVKYTENYSNTEGVGTFTIHIKQLYQKDIEVSEEASGTKENLNSTSEIEEQKNQEIKKENSNNNVYTSIKKGNLNFTQRLKKQKEQSNNITTVEYGEHFTKDGKKKVLRPNVEYTTPEGYTYRTDHLGRIVSCKGKLEKGTSKRNEYAQKIVGRQYRLPNDEGGHLIATIFKGSGDIDNLVPMDGNLNKGEWKKLENAWNKALSEIPPHEVYVEIIPVYEGNSLRPVKFIIEYKLDNDEYSRILDNSPGGGK